MAGSPLPVDVVTSTWDYVVGTAEIVGGLGSAGALLIAALAYKSQVDEGIVRQASKVTIRVITEDEKKLSTVRIINDGDQQVLLTDFGLTGTSGTEFAPSPPHLHSRWTLLAHDSVAIGAYKSDSTPPRKNVTFEDLSGRTWKLTDSGGLSRIPTSWLARYVYRRRLQRRNFG